MIFHPQQYTIPDKRMQPFIDPDEIWNYLRQAVPEKQKVHDIIQKSLDKNRLTLEETATLLQVTDPEMIDEIKMGARELKQRIYGNRIVLFAPLYIGNLCINNCAYCGFRTGNPSQKRNTLTLDDLIQQVVKLEDTGQKRLILVYGEHPKYNAEFIAETVRTVYAVKSKHGEIRRVNINAAPFDIEGFRTIHESKIGTYQVFQETYHEDTYREVHLGGIKRDFNWRLTALDRAQEAGIDDVGIGALIGLYDWRFEVMGLIRQAGIDQIGMVTEPAKGPAPNQPKGKGKI